MSTHWHPYPRLFEILLVPEHADDHTGPPDASTALRSAVVEVTGEIGESGYPRYAGSGMVADIDPETRTVEGLLIDGYEVDYGLSARVRDVPDPIGGAQPPAS
ncbi:hypothetical protein OG875_02065 [Streptomyces sp. NBC_01498]|uniref:hypothetical protein n=1 Tax=Streptomyces sp. NBC_01498 TaxID=2975870 RepID=UPI002E7AF814|nr:hypothetical protein [Streptomyces sp. NBC_01498]WTL23489.1 hypothetical protein OG875_02065 [Streptomyces sp. NBC_01498]